MARWSLCTAITMLIALHPGWDSAGEAAASPLSPDALWGAGAPTRLAPSWRGGKNGYFLAPGSLKLDGQSAPGPLGTLHQAQTIFGTSTGGVIGSLIVAAVVVVGIVGPAIAMRNNSGYLPWGIVGVSAGGIGLIWTLILIPGGVSVFWIGLPLFAASVGAVVLGSLCLVRWSRRRRRGRRYRRRRRRRRRSELTPHSHPSDRYFPPVVAGTPLTLRF